MARRIGEAPSRSAKGGKRANEKPANGEDKSLAPATINRICAAFKAALNLVADHDDRIVNRRAWETGLASIPDAEQSRNVILSEATVRSLIQEARTHSHAFGLLVEAAAVTGARVSQLARIEVQHLQADRSDADFSQGQGNEEGVAAAGSDSERARERLQALASGRPATAPLLVKPSGAPWKKSDHSRLFARAAKAAEQDPQKVTIYALRHSNIVRQLLAGVPIRVVAVNHDTSIAMLERAYSRHIGDFADALARGALLDMSEPSIDAFPAALPRTQSAISSDPPKRLDHITDERYAD